MLHVPKRYESSSLKLKACNKVFVKNDKDSLYSAGVGKGFMRSIGHVLFEDQLKEIRQSRFYSLVFDRSVNTNKKDVLLIFIRYQRKCGTIDTEHLKLYLDALSFMH